MKKPKGAIFPQAYFPAHQAQNGMIFGTKTNFPDKYKNGIFVASHGSWNRTEASGAEVQFVPVKNGKAGKMEVFASGWLDKKTGTYKGRPVDVAILKDGSMLYQMTMLVQFIEFHTVVKRLQALSKFHAYLRGNAGLN